jgi:hypothetical protein
MLLGYAQGRIYARAKGARAQGAKFPILKYGMGGKKAVHERVI